MLLFLLVIMGIVPSMAMPLKGRFVVFLKWLFIGYFRLGFRLYWVRRLPHRVRQLAPHGLKIGENTTTVKNTKNRPLRCIAKKGTILVHIYLKRGYGSSIVDNLYTKISSTQGISCNLNR